MKERIQYIKTVHSYVVLTGFLLFVAHVLSSNQEVLKAYDQLQDINSLINDWDETFLVQKGLEKNESHFSKSPLGNFKSRKISILDRTYYVQISSPSHTMIPFNESISGLGNVRIQESGNSEIPDIEAEQIYIRVPWTLKEFKTTWDGLKRPITIYKAMDVSNVIGFYLSPDTTIQMNNFKWEASKEPTDTLKVAFNPINPLVLSDLFEKSGNPDLLASIPDDVKQGYTDFNIPQFILSNKANPSEIFILFATTSETSFSGQKALLKELSEKYSVGDFRKSFPELFTVTKEFDDIYLDKLDPILATFSKRSEEQVEIFGAKLPIPAIVTWGVPILFILVLYYYLHLKNLESIINKNEISKEVAWIGLYNDNLSKFATIGSGILFPIVVTIILLNSGLRISLIKEDYFMLLFSSIMTILILTILGLTIVIHLKIWKKTKTSPNIT